MLRCLSMTKSEHDKKSITPPVRPYMVAWHVPANYYGGAATLGEAGVVVDESGADKVFGAVAEVAVFLA